MADLIIKIGAKSDQYQAELDKIKKQTANFEKQLAQVTKISAGAFVALSASTGLAVKEFAQFDNELRGVKTLLNESSFGAKGLENGFSDMRKEILQVGKTSAVELSSLNKALFDTVSAGVDAGEAVNVVATTAKLAVAGLTDVSTATDGVTSALNAYGISADKADVVASKFFAAQVAGKTTIAELSNNIGKTAATANAFGVDLDELLGSVSALTSGGIGTAQAFTGLNAVFAGVSKPTADAAAEAKRLGIEFNSTALRTKGLKGFLDELTQAQGFSQQSIEKLFGSVEAQKVAFSLTGGQAKLFASNVKTLSDEQANLNNFLKAYDTQSSSVQNSFKVLANNVKAAAITIGEQFAPFISFAAKAVQGLFTILQNPILAKTAALFLGIGTVVTGLVTVLGLGAQAFLSIRAAMLAANIQVNLMKFGIRGLVGATGLGLLLIVGYEIFANWSTIWPKMKSIFIDFANAVIPIAEDVANFFIGAFNTIIGGARNFVNFYIAIYKGLANTILSISSGIGDILVGVFTLDTDKIAEGVEKAKKAVVDGAKDTYEEAKAAITNTEPILAEVKFDMLEKDKLQEKVDQKTAGVKVKVPVEPSTGGAGEDKGGDEESVPALSDASVKRIAAIKNELALIKAERAGASAEELELTKRRNELAVKLEMAKANEVEAVRDQEIELVRQQQASLLKDEQDFYNKKQKLAVKDAEKKRVLQEEIKAFDDEFKANASAEDIERIQNDILTRDEIELAQREAKIQRELQERERFIQAEIEFGQQYAQLRRVFNQQEVQGALRASNQLVALQNSKNKELKGIGKAAALTQIAINTPRGALDAYASLAGIPIVGPALGAVAAGALIAYGAEQAGQVLAANAGGFVPGSLGTPGIDSVPASLTPNEFVVPAQTADEVINATAAARANEEGASTGGGGGTVTVILEPAGDFIGIIEQRQIEAEIQNTGVR